MNEERKEVWITGIGIISAIGKDVYSSLAYLKSGQSPLRPLQFTNSIHSGKYIGGAVDLSEEELNSRLKLVDRGYNRTAKLAIWAAGQALEDAGLFPALAKITSVNATTVGGMALTEKYYNEIFKEDKIVDENFLNQMDSGSVSRAVRHYFNLNKWHYHISTACSSGANAIMFGARLIRTGDTQVVLAGGSDSMSKFVLNGFLSLKNVDPLLCRPFDRDRFGLNLGEGAAYLVLEEKQHAIKRNKKPLAKLSGYANTSETYHITGSSPDGKGAYQAMSNAINMAALKPDEIDFVHTHGTSTIDNDLAESSALKRLFGNKIRFGSSKTYTGHTLAASGAISSVLTLGMMKEGFIFPSLNFNNPIEETGLIPVTELVENPDLRHCMVNSFGFGGNNTSLIYSSPA
ncbi:MAG: beta-ketoacyl-[acyl-carrier-protein] synthase family protein [Saprospiraceae bacterium]|nr:beta-ketoacyl-[acyl-carrier-protein] synthase family protein [Saprospiraceae bacterium]